MSTSIRLKTKIHLISDGRKNVAFCPTTMAAYSVDERTYAALSIFIKTGSPSEAAGAAGLKTSDLKQVIDRLARPSERHHSLRTQTGRLDTGDDQSTTDGRLDRLVLNVSNDCNLRCVYCYAGGGTYGGARGLMPCEIAVAAINWIVASFGGVRRIQFFGGEPLLNPSLIIEVCEYLRALKDAGKIQELPALAIVTNGTLGDERFIRLLRRYDIAATISIDGPECVHDALRGKGSYSKADRLARQCLNEGGIQTDFECTWTSFHLHQGVSIVDLIDYFFERYGVRVLHVAPVSVPSDHALHIDPKTREAAFEEAASYSVRNLLGGNPRANSLSQRVLESLLNRVPNALYCSAGAGTLAVSADGSLYPCFMLAGDPRFRMCRFAHSGKILENRAPAVSALLRKCDKRTREDCLACWAYPLCNGCLGGDLIETGDIVKRSSCDTIKTIARTVLFGFASADAHGCCDR